MKYLKKFESIEFEEELIQDLNDFFLSEVVEEVNIKKKTLVLTTSDSKLICPSCGNLEDTLNQTSTDCSNCGLEVIYPSTELYIEDAWLKPQDLVLTEPIHKYKYYSYLVKDGIGKLGLDDKIDAYSIESDYLNPIEDLNKSQLRRLNHILKQHNSEIYQIFSERGKKIYFVADADEIDKILIKIIEPRFVNEIELVL